MPIGHPSLPCRWGTPSLPWGRAWQQPSLKCRDTSDAQHIRYYDYYDNGNEYAVITNMSPHVVVDPLWWRLVQQGPVQQTSR